MVDKAAKRVHKLSAATKATTGQTSREGSLSTTRGGASRRGGNSGGKYNGGKQPYDRQRVNNYYDKPYFPPTPGRFNSGSYGSFGNGGGNRDNGQRTYMFYVWVNGAPSLIMPQGISTNALPPGILSNSVPSCLVIIRDAL
jgi:hypothetical protein